LLGNVHTQQFHIAAHILVGPLHSPPHPISPEDVLSIYSQPKGVDWLGLQDHIALRAVILAPLNLVQGGVREVEFLSTVVNGQAIGRADVLLDEGQDIGSRQGCPHDTWVLLIPVGPKHQVLALI
jgi:hypothetical protein